MRRAIFAVIAVAAVAAGVVIALSSGGGQAPLISGYAGSVSQRSGATGAVTDPRSSFSPLHVSGDQLLNASGRPVFLHAVDREGTEYKCVQGGTQLFDNDNNGSIAADTATNDDAAIHNMASWGINSEFIGLNEDCWLGINGATRDSSVGTRGAGYRAAIEHAVQTDEANHIYPMIGLFYEVPGTTTATGQDPLADNDHSPLFWEEVANTFKSDPYVMFRLEEEPYVGLNGNSLSNWKCWSQGDVSYSPSSDNTPPKPPTPVGTPDACTGQLKDQDGSGASYLGVGMQSMINIIRGTGATNIIDVPGINYANMLACSTTGNPTTCGFLDSAERVRVRDTLNPPQLMAGTDTYPNANSCGGSTTTCYDDTYQPVAQVMPLVADETSPLGNPPTKELTYLNWMDANANGYYDWAWFCGNLIAGNPPTCYTSKTPNQPWGQAYYDHVKGIVPPPPARPTNGIRIVQSQVNGGFGPGNRGGGKISLASVVGAGDDLFAVFGGQGFAGRPRPSTASRTT